MFGGLRGPSNNVSIDGLDNNDEYVGSSRTELSLETVQEFQVVNSGLSAEAGGASGGSINVVTRIGANQFHGDAFLFLQNGTLNARNPFEAEHDPPSLHRYRIGGALGGPIAKDRTFSTRRSSRNIIALSKIALSPQLWPPWSTVSSPPAPFRV